MNYTLNDTSWVNVSSLVNSNEFSKLNISVQTPPVASDTVKLKAYRYWLEF